MDERRHFVLCLTEQQILLLQNRGFEVYDTIANYFFGDEHNKLMEISVPTYRIHELKKLLPKYSKALSMV